MKNGFFLGKRVWVVAFAALLLSAGAGIPAAASTAAEIEMLLETQALTYAQVSRFVLDAADQGAFADPAQAFAFVQERNWLPRRASAEAPATLNGVALLLVQSFDLGGGLMFSLTRSAHFAYRELEHIGVIHGRRGQNQQVSGDILLYMTGRILGHLEAEQDRLALAGTRRERRAAARLEAQRLALAAQIYAHLEEQEIEDVFVDITEEGITIRLSDIQFLADSAEIPASEQEKLDEIAEILRGIPGRPSLRITGHTALAGTPAGRLLVSAERAQAVADYMVLLGVRAPGEIQTAGYGSERPIASNATTEGMALNRRVEIMILEN